MTKEQKQPCQEEKQALTPQKGQIHWEHSGARQDGHSEGRPRRQQKSSNDAVCLGNDFPFCTAMKEKSSSHLPELRSQLPEEHRAWVLEDAVCKMIRRYFKD